jgi:hypothetical protein
MSQSYESVKKHIKFLLSDLPSQNGHFTFEEICRHFSRQRIGVNILPATGPVAAGGDQGRDFETFKVFLKDAGSGDTSFYAGSVYSKTLAFACTTQKDGLPSKIKADVKNIVEQGTQVDGVYYFTSNNLPVSERHTITKWVHDTYKISLDIIDGEGLSEQLAEKNLFWIAEEYLKIPSEIFPPIEDVEYEKLKAKWKDYLPNHQNFSEFDDLKWVARGALFRELVKHDLLFWVEKLEAYSEIEGDIPLKRKASYEAIAVRMRGTRTLSGKEDFVRKYFSHGDFTSPIEVEDALVVLNYAEGGTRLGVAEFTQEELTEWRSRIESYVDERLKTEKNVAIQAILYETKGQLTINNPYADTLSEGIGWWLKLADLIESTPTFPLERFSNILTVLVPFIGDHPQFDELTKRTDDLLSKRIGGFAAAEKSRDRSLEFYKKKQVIKAIKELHKAKEHWFANETLKGSLVAMLLLTKWYSELGLTYASKYYGMAVAYMAARGLDEETKAYLPRGLAQVASAEYEQGNWASFLERAEMVLRGMGTFSPNMDENKTTQEMFQKILFYTGNIAGLSKVVSPDLTDFVKERVASWGISDWTDEVMQMAEEVWGKRPLLETTEILEENLTGNPFSDAGEERTAEWQQLGINWHVSWKNSFLETSKAEHFVAVLQIVLADLAREELYLLPVDAHIAIELEDREKFHIEQQHSNEEYRWKVLLPTAVPQGLEQVGDSNMEIFGVAVAMLAEISLLPNEKVLEKVKVAAQDGLTTKTFTVSSYETMYRDLTSGELFDEATKLPKPKFKLDLTKRVHAELAWRNDLVSAYSKERSDEDIKNRYERSLRVVRLTLPKLNQAAEFKKTVAELRVAGWKDWHILMAVGSIAMNYRMQNSGAQTEEAMKRSMTEQLNGQEDEGSLPVPLSEFSKKDIELNLYMTMPSTLRHLDLDIKNGTPHKEGLKKFLGERYNYWSDDIEHHNLFD